MNLRESCSKSHYKNLFAIIIEIGRPIKFTSQWLQVIKVVDASINHKFPHSRFINKFDKEEQVPSVSL